MDFVASKGPLSEEGNIFRAALPGALFLKPVLHAFTGNIRDTEKNPSLVGSQPLINVFVQSVWIIQYVIGRHRPQSAKPDFLGGSLRSCNQFSIQFRGALELADLSKALFPQWLL